MALSDNLIEKHRIAACDSGPLHFSAAMRFARAIEAAVRQDDEALIQRMLAALERCRFDSLNMTIKDMQECGDAATAARARLAPPPPTA